MVWCKDLYEAVENVDAIIITTDWPEFNSNKINFNKIAKLMKQKIIIDFRNMYEPSYISEIGFNYISLGRGRSRPS